MNFNTPHLWILLVFIGLSFLQWLVRRLQEQSAVNRQKQQAARRRDEILRTGREPDAPAQPAPSSPDAAARQARLRELRQKQLEEMRRKNSRQSPTTTVEARVPPRPSTTPARPTPTLGAPTGARQGARPGAGPGAGPGVGARPGTGPRPAPARPGQQPRPRPQGAPAQSRPPLRPVQQPAQRPQPAPQQRSIARPAGTEAPQITRRDRAAPPVGGLRDTTTPRSLESTPTLPDVHAPALPPQQAGRALVIGPGMSAADWRQAIIASEVLARPLAMRDEP